MYWGEGFIIQALLTLKTYITVHNLFCVINLGMDPDENFTFYEKGGVLKDPLLQGLKLTLRQHIQKQYSKIC